MTDRPILFSSAMVRALISGQKTQTRRVLLDQPKNSEPVGGGICDPQGLSEHPYCWLNGFDGSIVRPIIRPPSWLPGDRLWVREAWNTWGIFDDISPSALTGKEGIAFLADMENPKAEACGRRRASMHMPRWASRITLIVTEVRVQRIQNINGEDAKAEGVESLIAGTNRLGPTGSYRDNFRTLWDSLNAARGFGWDTNSWVTATTFTVHKANIDAMEEVA